jgi:hypothetical protein
MFRMHVSDEQTFMPAFVNEFEFHHVMRDMQQNSRQILQIYFDI